MALDLTGIDNRGSFYSPHYLDTLLERDLAPLVARWAEAEAATPPVRAPHKRLNGLAGAWFSARAASSDLPTDALDERFAAVADFHARLLEVLGYVRQPVTVGLPDGTLVPLAHEERRGGRAYLWVLQAPIPGEQDADPLDQAPLASQLRSEGEVTRSTWRELLDGPLFRYDDAPDWIVALVGGEVVLTHRHKWPRGKALAFDLDALFARRQPSALLATAALLHRDALAPTDGTCLHEHLDENSHKHAFAVSTDLREGAQQAIEILGNEAIYYLRTRAKVRVFGDDDNPGEVDAEQLTRECLIWLYRLIFLFYAESRGDELGVAPMNSEAYRRGYSLESLRALEAVPLTTPQAQEGTYLDTSLRKLFSLVAHGHGFHREQLQAFDGAGFRIPGLRGRLFDDAQTPLLARVRFRNSALQRVIALLSLSKERRREGRGRISYAQLGINQLGAVYEGLLSYTGFFARTDLCEVANAAENNKPDARTWFVPDDQHDRFDPAELVRDETGARRVHRRGTFLYRLAGRDREKSASYYTPEVLTRCLVKHTLAERLGEGPDRLPADDILELTVCEPAMGSGAFLNEAVTQLAAAYLERKKEETGLELPADRYGFELQRVKHRIAANGCYGVDLNPLAAELGRVSLWLNVLRPGAPAPFFDARIVTGNSLVGARREGYRRHQLVKSGKKNPDAWMKNAPEPIGSSRDDGLVYHWLLPAEGMAAFDGDKVVRSLLPEPVGQIRAWRKALDANWKPAEVDRLSALSAAVDRLWEAHVDARREALEAIDQRRPVWPDPEPPDATDRSETRLTEIWTEYTKRNTAGRRLKEAMDLWCALWFWPVQQAELLPGRQEWLDDLELLLLGAPRADLDRADDRQAQRLRLARHVAEQQRFLHWEWQFPEVFERGGFDLVAGNPPWIKVQWNEGGILSDLDPLLVIRRLSAKQMADLRAEVLSDERALTAYTTEFEALTGSKEFLNSVANYPLLQGVQTNLYKAFLVLGGALARNGVSGLIHQKGVYDDPRGGALRSWLAQRLRWHLHFSNKLTLFEGVKDEKHYEISIYTGSAGAPVGFRQVSNLFHPRTLDESLVHDGHGEVPGIKTAEGDWDLRGHRSRVVPVDEPTLALFAKLYDPLGTPTLEARLPVVHSREILEVLRKIAQAPRKLGDLEGQWFATEHFHETNQQHDGTIRRETRFPKDASEWVVSGPHFYVSTPFNKTPNEGCRHNQDYSVVDHMTMPDDYLPRTNYVPAVERNEYVRRTPKWNGVPVTRYYRHVHRRMAPPTGERTLAMAILPPGAAHTHTIVSMAYRDARELVWTVGACTSIVFDFFMKSTGKSDIYAQNLAALPRMEPGSSQIIARTLRLNCLTTHYADLWAELYDPAFRSDYFTKDDSRLDDWSHLGPDWRRDTPVRSPFARRQALVELDALAALALGLSADELCLIYRVQFPVLQQYEADTWYDRRGRIVFTANRGLTGVGLDRKRWEEIRHARAGDPLPPWAADALGPYEPPFDRCDREADMRQAYTAFQARLDVRLSTDAERALAVPLLEGR